MKKILLAFILLLSCNALVTADQITVDAFVSADDVTIAHLESFRTTVVDAINSFDGQNIQTGTISPDALDNNANPVNRWNEAFNDFVYTGLLPPTSADLTTTTTAGTAYVGGNRILKSATSKTYTANKWTFVDISSNGTYTYVESTIEAAEPAVTANSIRLARVVTDADNITSVRDDRVTSISLGSNNEDFYIKGFEIISADSYQVTIDAGVLMHGTTFVSKTTQTTLTLSTATDWHDGVVDSYSGGAGWAYIAIKSTGNFKWIGANAPNKADISGNTAGRFKYWYDNTNYWRVVGAVRINTGNAIANSCIQNGNIVFYMGSPPNMTTAASAGAWSSALSCVAGIPAYSDYALFGVANTESSSGATAYTTIRANGSVGVANPESAEENGLFGTFSGSTNCVLGGQLWHATDGSQQIQYYNYGGTDACDIDVIAYDTGSLR